MHRLIGVQRGEGVLHLAEQTGGFLKTAAFFAFALESIEVRFGGCQLRLQCANLFSTRAALHSFSGQQREPCRCRHGLTVLRDAGVFGQFTAASGKPRAAQIAGFTMQRPRAGQHAR